MERWLWKRSCEALLPPLAASRSVGLEETPEGLPRAGPPNPSHSHRRQRHDSAFLKAATLRLWGSIDPGHAKLRELVGELIDEGLWRLLWMPPTLPYWPLEGPFEGKEHATKRLLFSTWNLVPDVVSAVLSYEAERLMMGGRLNSYDKPDEQQRPLLRLTQSAAGVRSRHRLLLLLLPCLPLADRAHPLGAPPGLDRRAWVRARVDELLADPRLPNPRDGSVDDRWEWAALLLLDPELPAFLRAWRDGELPAGADSEPLPQPNPDLFGAYVDDLLAVDLQTLGRRPPDPAELLTDLALGSPAVLAARSLRSGSEVGDDTRRRLATLIAEAFWRLFNRPAVITLLRQLAAGTAAVRDESAYWRLVLHYCRQGNLQACSTSSGTCSGIRTRGPRTPARTKPPPSAHGSSSRWCTRRVPVSTPSSSRGNAENRARPSNACAWRSCRRSGAEEDARARASVGLLRSGLLKRFESSAFAFRRTTEKMVPRT